MSEWKKVKLSEICVSIADGDHQPPPKADEGIPFVTIRNIDAFNQFDFSDVMFVPQEYYDSLDDKRKAHKNDVLYSVVGSFGIPVLMKEERKFVFQRHIAILRPDEEKIDSRYLFYSMLSSDFYAQTDTVALGAAQRTVSLSALRNMTIYLPTLSDQKRIADILSVYDDLIDNNCKQIKLLEEAAQRLYKEWFVDLRFPSWEDTVIVNGVPEGWHRGTLSELISVCYGKDHKKAPEPGEIPVYGSGGIMRKCNKALYSGKSVLVPRKGSLNNIIYVDGPFWTVDTMFYTQLKREHFALFVYCYLSTQDMYAYNVGAAVPSMTVKILNDMELIIPSDSVMRQYDCIVSQFFLKRDILNQENESVSEARNRLLPKLMSGEIAV